MLRSVLSRKTTLLFSAPLLVSCSRIDSLLYQPETTPEQWCAGMPCVDFLSTGMVLNQPFSTLLVYVLGLMWLWAAWRLWRNKGAQHSRRWLAISMFLGGVAALSAGTSYQAFGYELKCAGNSLCTWTSWWEITYLVLQMASICTLLVAVAFACTRNGLRHWLITYACLSWLVHFSLTVYGALLPDRFLISFELLLLSSAPTFFLFFVINGRGYRAGEGGIHAVLLKAWAIMIAANAVYYAYFLSGITQVLWARGIWFSENDVLHVAMMIWVLYVGTAVAHELQDRPEPPAAT